MSPKVRLRVELWLVLALLLAGNFLVRGVLERWNHVSYFVLAGTDLSELQARPWIALLPIKIGGGQTWWATTSQLPVELLNRALTPRGCFLFLNALAIVATFWISWAALRSRIFTYTTSICMAFGTQLHYSYALTGTYSMYLQIVYLEWVLLCVYRLLADEAPQRRWQIGFVVGLLIYALGFDHWYNFLLFVWLITPLLLAFNRLQNRIDRNRGVWFLFVATTVAACVHLSIKLNYSEQHLSQGKEDELIVVYKYPLLAAEDFVSNVITYNFMSLTNYAPPFVLGSNSDYWLGSEKILAQQHGYHAAQTHLVAMHHRFLWYFYAGMLFAVYAYFLSMSIYRALRFGSSSWLVAAILLLGVFAGSGTHLLIKYRPYMSVPSLTYKCTPGVVAVTALLAYGLMLLPRNPYKPWLMKLCIGLIWASILYGGLTRPRVLSHLNSQVGLGGYPDPLQRISKWFGIDDKSLP